MLLTVALLAPVTSLAQSPARTKRNVKPLRRTTPPKAGAAPVNPPETTPPPVAPSVLALAKTRALIYLDELPDFIATQTTRRSVLVHGAWEPIDELEITVNYQRGKGETTHLVSVNGNRPDESYRKSWGAKAVGVFSFQFSTLFQPSSKTVFTEAGVEVYRGRDCRIYAYAVPKASSSYQLTANMTGNSPAVLTVGHSGRMWIDAKTGHPLRVEKIADDISPDFPLSNAEVVVEYDWVTISGEKYWLPVKSESVVELRENRRLYLNVTEFRDYRKFDGEVKVLD
jgi:hypothetical protein